MQHSPLRIIQATVALASLATLVATAAATHTAGADTPMTREATIDSTTVALVTTREPVSITPNAPIRIGPGHSLAELPTIIAGTDSTVISQLAEAIDSARTELGEAADTTAFLLANISNHCIPVDEVRVVRPAPSPTPRDVTVAATFVDDGTDYECFSPMATIAVVAVDATEVPIGGADQAELVGFTFLTEGEGAGAAALASMSLPRSGPFTTRLAVEFIGCQERSAELVITSEQVHAIGNQGDDTPGPMCVAPEYYLAVFDVDRTALPANVPIIGVIDAGTDAGGDLEPDASSTTP